MRLLLVATVCCLSACLTVPEPAGDTGEANGSNNLNGDNDSNDPGDADEDGDAAVEDMSSMQNDSGDEDEEPECASCTVGATRCAPEGEAVQECVDANGCHFWVTQHTCAGTQTCDDDDGCTCPDVCEPGDYNCDGADDGVMVCRVIEGCPQFVDVGRDESCAPPGPPAGAPSCEDRPDLSYCKRCDDGRGCNQFCQSDRGWSCGTPTSF